MLGYGAWHAHTHATLSFYLSEHAGRSSVQDALLLLRDAQGVPLATVQLRPPYGLPHYAGAGAVDCSVEEAQGGAAWRECFERQSRWFAPWAARVVSADIVLADCRIAAVPLVNTSYSDWWLWWVPLPHVGGTPYRNVALRGAVDRAHCAPATAP